MVKPFGMLVAISILVLLPSMMLSVSAQDDDPLQKVTTAEKALATYDSFVIHEEVVTENVISNGEFMITTKSLQTRMHNVILGDNPNVLSKYYYDNGVKEGYSITAEVRFVDGDLYVNAVLNDIGIPNDNLGAIPDGWILLEAYEDWPGLDVLDLWLLFDIETDKVVISLFEGEIMLTDLAEVSVSMETAEDGTELEVISLTLDASDMENSFAHLGGKLLPSSSEEALITLDADGHLVRYDYAGLEYYLVKDTTGNTQTTLLWDFTTAYTISFSNINRDLTPVEAPAIE